jgi:hypothetical protein
VNGGEVLRSEEPVQTVSQRPVASVKGEVTSDVKGVNVPGFLELPIGGESEGHLVVNCI